MLNDREMEQASGQLAAFRVANGKHQTDLTEMLEKYATLLDDYNRLKSDYEEERDSRERYKQMARGQERNPFVLVLIDGDGYIFDDDLISSGAEGGQRAAQLLDQAVKDSLRHRGLENCRVMVRIFANLAGLSKTLARTKLAGPEKRSLAPFVANFNRSNELFDFVDAGELKENADFKLRAMFRLFMENVQCRHIYFAGCHDVGYITELTPYVGNRDRITLVRSASFHHEFSKLGMRTESFPNVFRLTPLDVFAQQPTTNNLPTRPAEPSAPASNDQSGPVCKFFQQGKCAYGQTCRNLHIPKSNTNGNTGPTNMGSSSIQNDWRQRSSDNQVSTPFSMPTLTRNDNEFFTETPRARNVTQTRSSEEFLGVLPQPKDIPRGEVAVNNKQHRLDAYIMPASQDDWTAFNSRAAKHKLCNNFHLTGSCTKGSDCQYDHTPISPGMMTCLKQVAHDLPCPRRGNCRLETCIQGHICQKAECKFRGGKTYCRIPPIAHTQDLHVAQYMPASSPQQTFTFDENDTNAAASGKGSSPSLRERSESVTVESDDEKQHGAPLDMNDTDSLD